MNRLAVMAAALMFITVNAQAMKKVARTKSIAINNKLANAMYQSGHGHVVKSDGKFSQLEGVHWDLQTRLNDSLNVDGQQVKRYDVLLQKLAEEAKSDASSAKFLDSIRANMGEISSMNGAQRQSVAAAYAAWKNPSELDAALGSRASEASFRKDLKELYPKVAKNISEDSAIMKQILDISSGRGDGETLRNQAGATILSKLEANIGKVGVEKAIKSAEAEIKTVREIFESLQKESNAAFNRATTVSLESGADDLFGATKSHAKTQEGRRLDNALDIADGQHTAKKAQMISAELGDTSPGAAERVRLAFSDPEKSDVLLKVFDRVKNELEPEFVQKRNEIEERFERENGRKAFSEAELWGFFVKEKTDVDIYAKGGICEQCVGKATVCKK